MADRKVPPRNSPLSSANKPESASITEPIGVYMVTRHGVALPSGTPDAAKWDDLKDVGRRLSCPPMPGETLREYARRLWVRLEPLKRDEYLNGAAVYMLRHIVNMYLRAE